MSFLKWRIFQAGIFKQAKFLVSTPQQAQKSVYISEAGTVSMELLPVHTGWMSSPLKKAWLVVHNLKFTIYKDGQSVDEESQVLIISDRRHIPLDPNETMKKNALDKLASLKDIARLRHADARSQAGRPEEQRDIPSLIINGGFILLGIYGIIKLVMAMVVK